MIGAIYCIKRGIKDGACVDTRPVLLVDCLFTIRLIKHELSDLKLQLPIAISQETTFFVCQFKTIYIQSLDRIRSPSF